MVKKVILIAAALVATALAVVTGAVEAADVEGWFFHDDMIRRYILHVPPQHNGEDSLPLVINLHGYTGSSGAQAAYTGMSTKADAEGFLVVYPNGTGSVTGWNAGLCCGSPVENEIDDVGFIDALIDTIRANYIVDTLRIYATGFSNGGMMSHRLACELSERIAAVAPVAGGLVMEDWDDCRPPRAVPVIAFHARNDGAVPYYGGPLEGFFAASLDSVMSTWARWDSCDVGPDTFYQNDTAFSQTWSQTEGDVEVVFWTTEDGGHSWPGRIGASQAISANEEMWEFFLAHPMPVEEPEPGVGELPFVPAYSLDPSSPNLFTNSVTIRFSQAQAEHVTIKLYDVLGREIATLVDGTLDAGEHSVLVDAAGLSAGVYFYRLATPTFTATRLIMLVK